MVCCLCIENGEVVPIYAAFGKFFCSLKCCFCVSGTAKLHKSIWTSSFSTSFWNGNIRTFRKKLFQLIFCHSLDESINEETCWIYWSIATNLSFAILLIIGRFLPFGFRSTIIHINMTLCFSGCLKYSI